MEKSNGTPHGNIPWEGEEDLEFPSQTLEIKQGNLINLETLQNSEQNDTHPNQNNNNTNNNTE